MQAHGNTIIFSQSSSIIIITYLQCADIQTKRGHRLHSESQKQL